MPARPFGGARYGGTQRGATRSRAARGATGRGFTLIEGLVVLLFVTMLVALGFPALQQMIHRSRLEGTARECAVLCQRARLEAIKQGVPVVVRFDTTDRTVESWLDADGNGTQEPTETEFAIVTLPGTIDYLAPTSQEEVWIDNGSGENVDSEGGWLTFFTDGSIDFTGDVRFGDSRQNYLQLSLGPVATGQVELSKWDEELDEWLQPREDRPWKWN